MDDLPIIELPEHYRIDGENLGMALAHVSAQASSIAEHQAKFQQRQLLHEEEQQRFIEQRVAAARDEADARCQALVLAIKQAYGDPSTLELRVDARIQDVLQQLQHGAQEQARALAEAQLANQAALRQLMERRMDDALQQIEQKASLRTDRHLRDMREDMYKYVEDRFQVAIRRSDDNALALVRGELKTRRADHHNSITRSEARVVELVRGILDQYDSATRVRQEQERETLTDRVEARLRDVVVVAITAAENKVRDMAVMKVSSTAPLGSSVMTETASTQTATAEPTHKAVTSKTRLRSQRRLERRVREQEDSVKKAEAARTRRQPEHRAMQKWSVFGKKPRKLYGVELLLELQS